MTDVRNIDYDDIQALARFGHGHLKDSRFLLLTINDRVSAGSWLGKTQFNSAQAGKALPEFAIQIAFTYSGLAALGLPKDVSAQFSEEFIVGMSGDESRSRRLGDIEQSAPDQWQWGHDDKEQLHVLLLLYARTGSIDNLYSTVACNLFEKAFTQLHTLPTSPLSPVEPFGFIDGISQPSIDWTQDQKTDVHARDSYSNLLAPGEIVLGYNNEYGQLTRRPLIDEEVTSTNTVLPVAHDDPSYRDFGGNGSYMILRQLQQDVAGFRSFLSENADGKPDASEKLAAAMVGRQKNGEPLVKPATRQIPGIPLSRTNNHFDYDQDPDGIQCPVGSHVRRSNPRVGDFAPGVTGLWSRLQRMLGFKRKSEYEDLVASSRFHRILRRGRAYENTEGSSETGLQFICLAGNILRQFEFIQSAWSVSSAFAGTREQRDPLLGHRQARLNGTRTDTFMQADKRGAQIKTASLPAFVTLRGGGYFFMPGIRAIRYLAELAERESPE